MNNSFEILKKWYSNILFITENTFSLSSVLIAIHVYECVFLCVCLKLSESERSKILFRQIHVYTRYIL